MEPIKITDARKHGRPPDRERRHRPDHPGALPQGDRARRASATSAVRRLALRRRRDAQGGLRPQPARGAGRARSWSRATTSAAARRASTRPGRSSTSASAPSSARRSPTSSGTTRSRTASCRSSSSRPRTPSFWRRPGRSVTISARGPDADAPRRDAASVPDRPVRALLPAERRRRARSSCCRQEAAIAAFEARRG